MSIVKFLILTICSFGFFVQLNAQTLTGPVTIGLDIGIPLEHKPDSVIVPFDLQVFDLRLAYRFKRWLSVSTHLGYNNISTWGEEYEFGGALSSSNLWVWTGNIHQFNISFGPDLHLRLGQGDFSTHAQIGLMVHGAQLYASDLTQEYPLTYSTQIHTYSSLAMSYTYWPKAKFGLRLGFQVQNWLRLGTANTSYEIKPTVRARFPELDNSTLERFTLPAAAYEALVLQFGVTYRL